ncbi:hypothetical protein P3T18_000659 [Paraburkholderia sp. GAS199]
MKFASEVVEFLHLTRRCRTGQPDHAIRTLDETLRERRVFRRHRMQARRVEQNEVFAERDALETRRGFRDAFLKGSARFDDTTGIEQKVLDRFAVSRETLRDEIAKRTLARVELAEYQQDDFAIERIRQRLGLVQRLRWLQAACRVPVERRVDGLRLNSQLTTRTQTGSIHPTVPQISNPAGEPRVERLHDVRHIAPPEFKLVGFGDKTLLVADVRFHRAAFRLTNDADA